MPKIALFRPAISQPCGIGEVQVGACAYRGGGGGGGGGGRGRADPSRFSKKYLSPPCLRLDQSCTPLGQSKKIVHIRFQEYIVLKIDL